ncbi:MAG TPA: cupin domain-containing protein [Caulobacteraceae bacterium]|jgi:1,2-dihydroxy-3-keto-5-methylthiopentene dioxygenase|nr:cupin domain-containing protein [Caulobacteraceae bacterium]
MSRLTIHRDDAPAIPLSTTGEANVIAEQLAEIGVAFERWAATAPLPREADDAAVLAAYAGDIDRLKRRGGYQAVDVIRMTPDNPAAGELRAKFLAEHTHADDEVRFFVEGAAQFYLHGGGKVFMLVCEAGDLISIPAGTRHWFDMGPKPHFTALRLFISPAGWVADFTGADIAKGFPKYELAA